MNKKIADNLIDASDASEQLLKRLPDLSLEDKIDVAARLRAVVKNMNTIDELIKGEIKKKLKGKDGTLMGDIFKCALQNVTAKRFDSATFKADHPDTYDKYSVEQVQQRITFEAR